jgi:hypothetical protein
MATPGKIKVKSNNLFIIWIVFLIVLGVIGYIYMFNHLTVEELEKIAILKYLFT